MRTKASHLPSWEKAGLDGSGDPSVTWCSAFVVPSRTYNSPRDTKASWPCPWRPAACTVGPTVGVEDGVDRDVDGPEGTDERGPKATTTTKAPTPAVATNVTTPLLRFRRRRISCRPRSLA